MSTPLMAQLIEEIHNSVPLIVVTYPGRGKAVGADHTGPDAEEWLQRPRDPIYAPGNDNIAPDCYNLVTLFSSRGRITVFLPAEDS
jgi:hypothetical protein